MFHPTSGRKVTHHSSIAKERQDRSWSTDVYSTCIWHDYSIHWHCAAGFRILERVSRTSGKQSGLSIRKQRMVSTANSFHSVNIKDRLAILYVMLLPAQIQRTYWYDTQIGARVLILTTPRWYWNSAVWRLNRRIHVSVGTEIVWLLRPHKQLPGVEVNIKHPEVIPSQSYTEFISW